MVYHFKSNLKLKDEVTEVETVRSQRRVGFTVHSSWWE